MRDIDAPHDGVLARQRQVAPLIEFRVPFRLTRQAVDDVERGAQDSDWQPVKDAARQIAFAEDRAIFEGYPAGGIAGIRRGGQQPAGDAARRRDRLPGWRSPRPCATCGWLASTARTRWCSAPTRTPPSARPRDHGYPVYEHIKRLISGEIIWAPAIEGAFVLTTRGGDFALHLGQDVSIGYLGHDAASIELYLQETLTFLVATSEAAVALATATP